MNPELPQVRPVGETMPQIPGGVEYFPAPGGVPELAPSPELQPAPAEQLRQPAQQAPYVAAPVAPVLSPAQPQTPVQPVSDVPIVAADEDLIEKEWVDKLKKIITLTKGNPYEQAKAIAALQADYLKKRYNRDVGESNNA